MTLGQKLRLSTDHDAAMNAADICDLRKRLVLATPTDANMHELTGEFKGFKGTNKDKECRAKQGSRIRVRMYVYVCTSHVRARGLRTPTICTLEIRRTRTLEPCPKPETPRSLWATPWTPVYVEMYV